MASLPCGVDEVGGDREGVDNESMTGRPSFWSLVAVFAAYCTEKRRFCASFEVFRIEDRYCWDFIDEIISLNSFNHLYSLLATFTSYGGLTEYSVGCIKNSSFVFYN